MLIQIIKGILIPFIGTALGAACVFFMKNSLSRFVQKILVGFAAGVMTAASVWSLIIPSIEQSADMGKLSFIPAAVGFLIGVLFLLVRDHITMRLNKTSSDGLKSTKKKNKALVLAVTLHNIPEGMAVAVPLIAGGMPRGRPILMTAISGFPTVIGAVIGFLLGSMGEVWHVLSLAFASGAMLYVVMGELMPEAILMWKSKLPAFAGLVGIIVGMIVIYL